MPINETDAHTEDLPLQLLLVDHVDFDAQLIVSRLQRDGLAFRLRRVETAGEFCDALREPVDLVLSEIELPQFGAPEALALLQHGAWDVPLVLVTAAGDEATAMRLLQEGAVDYVLKDRMARLPQSVRLAVERARMLRRLRQKQVSMARLSLQLVRAQELERGNLARELHDELGQRLTALNMQLYRLQPEPGSARLAAWDEARQSVADMVTQVRNLSITLRPPELDYVGLQASISNLLARRFADTWQSQVFEYVGLPDRLPPLLEITCYRLVQESLTNIARHANARSVVIEMVGNGDEVEIIVRDDGAGFDVHQWERNIAARPSGGVVGMRERAHLLGGTLTVTSRPGAGTRITATLPLNDGGSHEGNAGG
jgi:signal transduction histidine kinase